MDSKEKYPGPNHKRILECESLINLDNFPTTNNLSISIKDFEERNISFDLKTRPLENDIIWNISDNTNSYGVYGVSLDNTYLHNQSLNEIAGSFIYNSQAEEKCQIFFPFSNNSKKIYKASQITHPLTLNKWEEIYGYNFTADQASNFNDLIANVLIVKVANACDINNGSFLINPTDKSVKIIDREFYFQGRDGNEFQASINGNILESDIFGLSLVKENEGLAKMCKENLIEFMSNKNNLNELEYKLHQFRLQIYKKVTFISNKENLQIKMEESIKNILEVLKRRFNPKFIETCADKILQLAKSNQYPKLLVDKINYGNET